jgi:hypothetical protein
MKKLLVLTALGLFIAAHGAVAVMTFAQIPAIADGSCSGSNC